MRRPVLLLLATFLCLLHSNAADSDEDNEKKLHSLSEKKSSSGSQHIPRWFNTKTMRKIGSDGVPLYGYAAFIPSKEPKYNPITDPKLPLARRLNAGYILPNTFTPGQWAPLRSFFEEPEQVEDQAGVPQSFRFENRFVSWFTVASVVFGNFGHVPLIGDYFAEDPLTPHYNHGINALPSPVIIPRIIGWTFLSCLPINWLKYPYLPWKPWKPWKFEFSDLPSASLLNSFAHYCHDPALRGPPCVKHPSRRERSDVIKKRKPSDRDQTICAEWPIWSVAKGTTKLHYPEREVLLILQGEAVLRTAGKEVKVTAGELVIISAGSQCEWDVKEAMMAHFNLGD